MNDLGLKIERDGSVVRVTLNRPQIHNAFDDTLISLLDRTAGDLAADESVRVVVLAGDGKSFCAGADVNWMKRMADYSEEENLNDSMAMAGMFEAWAELPMPVVGRIQGAAIGGGMGLVSVCDIAVASTAAVFGFTEVRLGILPAVISPFVVGKIGVAAARALFLTGERFTVDRALAVGLVQQVTVPDELDKAVGSVVDNLLAGGPLAQRTTKRLLARLGGVSPGEVRNLTSSTIAGARVSPEGQEGLRAFLERRSPSWLEER